MASQDMNGDDESLRSHLQALVRQICLRNGKVKLVMHEGKIQFIDVRPSYRVEFKTNDAGLNESGDEIIRLKDVEPFVRSRLERPIFNRIGRFGHVKVKVKGGIVCDWHFSRRYRFAQKESKQLV